MNMEFWNEIRYEIEEMDFQHERYGFLGKGEYIWECPWCGETSVTRNRRRNAVIGLVSHCLVHGKRKE